MFRFLFLLFLLLNLPVQGQSRKVTLCHSGYTVYDRFLPADFSSQGLTDSLRAKPQPKYHLWIGYYSADTNKTAFVSAYEKPIGGLVNRIRKIKSTGFQFEFYRDHAANGKMYCGINQAFRRKAYFVNGKLLRFEEFHPGGAIKASGQYNRKGEKDGEWSLYDERGRRTSKEVWQNGKLVSKG